MKKLLSILVLSLLFGGNVYAEETFLSCRHETGSTIVLSFDNETKLGKEYIGGDTQITYDLVLSEANIFFVSNTRSWNIDRFSGAANLNNKNADNSWRTVRWFCKKAEKKF
ncbi:hypothetical protein [Candidatus Pelagibacter sp. HIMB1782]|uniref:hypothetical protein n=1 Tax=Candidatus Pelagibacter sp. HIMB1782 TaxID=3413375 RepID=UPI003F874135